jgi:CHASE3 domain sensor protein
MPRLRVNIGLDRLSIRSRIFGGFGVVLLLLGILATVSLRGTIVVQHESTDVEASSEIASSVAAFSSLAEQARVACSAMRCRRTTATCRRPRMP